MRLIAILAAMLLAGCDTERDMKIVVTDVQVLVNTCARNGGMKDAQRALPFLSGQWQWRVKCNDGALFVVPVTYGAPER